MEKPYLKKFVLPLLLLGLAATHLWAQSRQAVDFSKPLALTEYLKLMQAAGCVEDLPAPTLVPEPRFTIGSTNQVCFRLPSRAQIPIVQEKIYQPLVRTFVVTGADTTIERTLVNLDSTSTQLVDIAGTPLLNGTTYHYFMDLIVGELVKENGVIVDIIFHCSPLSNFTRSTQDSEPPVVENVTIPQLSSTPVPGWLNTPSVRILAGLRDGAGVWQASLFRRTCTETGWPASVADSTYPGTASDSGFVFLQSAQAAFVQNLPDGCYAFRVEGKDATHTPESCGSSLQLAGNGGVPLSNSPAQVQVNIDTRPPASVDLACTQTRNSIELQWTGSSDPAPGVGLMGYRVLRDGVLIATLDNTTTEFREDFPAETPDTLFVYRILPFDSLGNVQSRGGTASCIFRAGPQVTLFAEPRFTPGASNTVFWRASGAIASLKIFLDAECDFVVDDSVSVQDPAVTRATFSNLEDGKRYCYWIRAEDEQQRVVYSDTVMSVQDATPPEITSLEVLHKTTIAGRDWVKTRNIQLRLLAEDQVPGQIWNFQISENSLPAALRSNPDSSRQLNTTLPFSLTAPECQSIALTAKVIDGAGNGSALSTAAVFLDATPPDSVTVLSCEQSLNSIHIAWSATVDPGACSGLQGYLILRNQVLIDSVTFEQTEYTDRFPDQAAGATFVYQIQPFDSLRNVQTAGGQAVCTFVGRPEITLLPEPEFTPGLSNTVCWSVSGSVANLRLFVDEDCDFAPEDSVFLDDAGATCYTFEGLSDGSKYCYWLKARDPQNRMVYSDTVMSTQDASAPKIVSVAIANAEVIDGQTWVFARDLQVSVVANDARNGEIWNYEILENDQLGAASNFADSSGQVKTTLSYLLQTPGGGPTPIRLSLKVIDGAGNESQAFTTGFVFQDQSFLKRMFAFPNPYNPMKGRLTIRFNDPKETEVKIYDFFGNLVRTLTTKAGSLDFVWDGLNGKGQMVANGGYICVGKQSKAQFKLGVVKQ
ncbi:MAG: FlgD immunoglobulin-like domain containing protein [bacterium]